MGGASCFYDDAPMAFHFWMNTIGAKLLFWKCKRTDRVEGSSGFPAGVNLIVSQYNHFFFATRFNYMKVVLNEP